MGVAVGKEVVAGGAGGLDAFQGGVQLPPVGRAIGLEVRDLRVDAGLANKMGHLVNRLKELVALTAHVGGIHPATFGAGIGKGQDLLRGGVLAGEVNQSGREAPGTFVEGLLEIAHHHAEFVRGGLAGRFAHRPLAQGVVPGKEDVVDGRLCGFQTGAIVGDGIPIGTRGFAARARGIGLRFPIRGEAGLVEARGGTPTALAADFGGDALGQLARGGGFEKEVGIGVGVRIDEAGGEPLAAGINFRGGLRCGEIADCGDTFAGNTEVRRERGGTGAIKERCLTQNKIEVHAAYYRAFRRKLPNGV